jgi:hypothetical protein
MKRVVVPSCTNHTFCLYRPGILTKLSASSVIRSMKHNINGPRNTDTNFKRELLLMSGLS